MNTLLTSLIFALVALAAAKPGYNYQQPAPQYIAPVQQQNVYSAPIQAPVAQYQQHNYQPQQQVIVSKDVFIHSAPEETEEIGNDQSVEPGPIRKNYRIVFVKAPTHNIRLNLASVKRAQASNEEKTVIYVLSKKPDIQTIQNQLSDVQPEQIAHKPEVYFIKYKTQEEANRAQQEIQAQYDSLGGSTHISDEGIAPVTSVIGGGRVNVGSVGTSFNGGNGGSVGTSFNGGNGGSVGTSFNGGNGGNGGLIGTSFNGGNVVADIGGGVNSVGTSYNGGSFNSVGTSFNGGNVGSAIDGGSIVQAAGPVQQSYQSIQSSSSSAGGFSGAPSQNYLPIKKK